MSDETSRQQGNNPGGIIARARRAAATWFNSDGSRFSNRLSACSATTKFLGSGKEGVVFQIEDNACKCFRPGTIDRDDVARLEELLPKMTGWLPTPNWHLHENLWVGRYDYEQTEPVDSIDRDEAIEFLAACVNADVVCANIKFSNFRRRMNGSLLFVDIGRDIHRLERSWFINSCARMYLLVSQGISDAQLKQHTPHLLRPGAYDQLPGLNEFVRDIMARASERYLNRQHHWPDNHRLAALPVTLLIKACAMDAHFLREQVQHIVGRLETPRPFAKRLLLIDPKTRNFVREHHPGNLDKLLNDAEGLCEDGWVDEVLLAPLDGDETAACNRRWFGLPTPHAHNTEGVPVAPQLWGFEQVQTRWLLQCDIDALIGRRDTRHDFLKDMLTAANQPDVVGVAFNIPWDPKAGHRPYFAPPGEFVPEVRCGLLDLHAMEALKPLPNWLDDGRLKLTWYRSVQRSQKERGLRTLRGGDGCSYYIHPPNEEKHRPSLLATVRDRIGSSEPPRGQWQKWDLDSTLDWNREERREDLIFYLSGHNTSRRQLERCAAGLLGQIDQSFGVVIVDDASTNRASGEIEDIFRPFRSRLTIVRCRRHRGRARNMIDILDQVCTRQDSLVALCDLDDVLMRADVGSTLKTMGQQGHDLVIMPSFRPCRAFESKVLDLDEAIASERGDIWGHLAAGRARLFHQLSHDHGATYPAAMKALAAQAQQTALIDGYWMLHEPWSPLICANDGETRVKPNATKTGEKESYS